MNREERRRTRAFEDLSKAIMRLQSSFEKLLAMAPDIELSINLKKSPDKNGYFHKDGCNNPDCDGTCPEKSG